MMKEERLAGFDGADDDVGDILVDIVDKYIMIQCLFVTFLFIPAPPPPRVVMFG